MLSTYSAFKTFYKKKCCLFFSIKCLTKFRTLGMPNSEQSGPPPVCDLQNIALYENGPKARVCLSCF